MIAAGQSIGNYRILSKIGTGGMGAVYLAEHPLIGKKVALKVIHRELSGNKEVVQRFFQEARAVNKIGSEHIVEIHDFGATPEGDHFYIMEYLEGRTLASVLSEEKRLDIMRALHIGAQIANALAAAHASGVIHRDLKPDNIMLMSRLGDPDFVKVLDFGLAKVFAAGTSAVKTAAGVLLGTPQYMSPEACESKRDIDHRTDVYALGVLLFQMMTGVLPFDGESMGEVLVKQVTALPPAPRGINPQIAPSVEQVLLRCLAKPVDARFQSMVQLREALIDPEAYLRGSPPIAPARSVAPGEARVDAKTVIAHAAAMQAQQAGGAAQAQANAKTRIAEHGAMLPIPGAAPEPWQVAPTVHGDSLPGAVKQVIPRTGALPIPQLMPSNAPKNNTMRIATPMGYSSRPPRKMWPIVLVLGLVFGLGGGAFAVAWFGRDPNGGTGSGTASGDSGSAVVATGSDTHPDAVSEVHREVDAAVAAVHQVDAAVAATVAVDAAVAATAVDAAAAVPVPDIDAGAAAPRLVKLTLESTPAGASVIGPGGKLLGKTPLKLEWPVAPTPVSFELKLSGYKKKTKELTVTSNVTVGVELERAPILPNPGRGSNTGKGSGSGTGKGSNPDLIRPGD